MKLPQLTETLDAIARSIVGLPEELQAAIGEVVRVNRELAARQSELEIEQQTKDAEIARLNDLVTTQRDALLSVKRALAAWEQLLEP